MLAQHPPYPDLRNSRETNRNLGDTYGHTRSNNAQPFTSRKSETGQWPTLKDHLVAASGEFVGKTLFLFAFGGTQVASGEQEQTHRHKTSSLHRTKLWLLPRRQRMGILPYWRRSIQPSCEPVFRIYREGFYLC
jgi:hypothetical protein